MINSEADIALLHVMSGSAYSHTLHQGNLHQYGPGCAGPLGRWAG